MPFIPTVQPQQQAATPDVPRGRVATPQVDLSSVAAAAGRLAGASQQAETPIEPFLAPGRGLQQVGQGLGDVGGVLGQLAAARAQAQNDLHVAEAQTVLDMAFADMEKVKQTASPEQWENEWTTRRTAALEQVFQNESLSPIARQRLQVLAKRWEGDTQVRVAQAATIEIGRRAEDAWQVNFARALETNDLERAKEINDNGNEVYVSPSAKFRNEQILKEKRKELEYQVYYDQMRADPRAFLAGMKERPEGMEPATHSRLVNAAQEIDQENVAADADRMQNAIVAGAIKVPEEVDKWEPDNARITPEMREAARGVVARRNDATYQANLLARAPELASQLYTEARNFDFAKDGDLAYYKLRLRINELPAPLQGEVSGVLEAKFPGRAGGPKAGKEVNELVEETLTSMFNNGEFGAFDHDTVVKGKDGKETIESKRSRLDYERALREKAVAGGKIRRWLESNPNAKPEDAQKKLYELVPESTRVGLFEKMDEAMKRALDAVGMATAAVRPTDPAQTPGTPSDNEELPQNPGELKNLLLPPPLPPPPQ